MSVPTKESLMNDLRGLGIRTGETVYFKVDLSSVSPSPRTYNTFFEAALELAGPDGTIVCPTFTGGGRLEKLDKDQPFDINSPSHSGGWLAKLFLNHRDVIRSRHPLSSFAAIGKHAEYICASHDETKPAVWPICRMMELDAKQPIIGCVDNNPGFTTVHWAQYTVGAAARLRKKGEYGVYYRNEDKLELFVANHRGGCSLGFGKFYARYEDRGIVTKGTVGDAYSICTTMQEAFEIEEEILRKNPRFALCDNPWCGKCRTMWNYNKRDIPIYYFRHLLKRVTR